MILHEYWKRLIGQRKCGAFDEPDERDWEYTKEVGNALRSQKGDMSDLSIYYQDQGNLPACTAYSLAHCINIEIGKRFHYFSDVRGADLWKHQKEDAGNNLSQGDSLQHALKCAHKYKLFDHVKKKWFDIKYYRVLKEDALRVLDADNVTLYTGLLADYPMCDSNWYWRNTKKGGGHALCAFDGEIGVRGTGINSWKGWGYKKTGVWHWNAQDTGSLFSFYAIEVVES